MYIYTTLYLMYTLTTTTSACETMIGVCVRTCFIVYSVCVFNNYYCIIPFPIAFISEIH